MKVYLVGSTNFEVDAFLRFLGESSSLREDAAPREHAWRRTSNAGPAEELVEAAGRICYMSFGNRQSPRSNEDYIARLIEMGHESVLEHVSWTFVITDVSRALTHQLVRHRVGFAFSQLSQQYHEDRDPLFVEPALLNRFPKAQEAWRRAITVAKESYCEILEQLNQIDRNSVPDLDFKEIHRAVRSAARSVLPNATATTIAVTINARALRHFLSVRGCIPGDEEMRLLASELFKLVREEAPSILVDFKLDTLKDGSPIVFRERKEPIELRNSKEEREDHA